MAENRVWQGLVGDIGGTNARLALVAADGQPCEVRVLACVDHESLADAVRAYLATQAERVPPTMVLAVATPVLGDQIRLTNNPWSFSIEATRRELGCEQLRVINDFEALAMSLPMLAEEDLRRLDSDDAEPLANGVKVVVGPGTGLGVAGLLPKPSGWLPLATEGGHVSLAPTDEEESAVIHHLWHDYRHVSAERLLSGSGIVLLYATLCALSGRPAAAAEPAEVAALARAGHCEQAARTFRLFSGLLGGMAGNLALSYGSRGGLYLGGGVLEKLGGLFDPERFCQKFVAKGRFEPYLRGIPRWHVTAPFPALRGATRILLDSIQY